MKKVLLTGATGFIGRHCLPALLARGYEVHAISSKPPGAELKFAGVHWHQADLLAGQAAQVVTHIKPTHLLHLAWYTAPGKFWTSTQNLRWVQASLDLLDGFTASGGRRAVMAGSCAEYDWEQGICFEETTPLSPSTLYGASKHGLRLIFEACARQTGISAAWGRVFFLYGPYEYPERLVASVARSLLHNESARCSHGEQVRDLLYSQDVGEAFVALLDSEVTGAVNIASGSGVTLREVITLIGEKLGRQELIQLGAIPAPANDPPVLVADVRRLREEVKWQPQYDLEQGLDATIKWWTEQQQQLQEKSSSG